MLIKWKFQGNRYISLQEESLRIMLSVSLQNGKMQSKYINCPLLSFGQEKSYCRSRIYKFNKDDFLFQFWFLPSFQTAVTLKHLKKDKLFINSFSLFTCTLKNGNGQSIIKTYNDSQSFLKVKFTQNCKHPWNTHSIYIRFLIIIFNSELTFLKQLFI